jgi:AcrR family transcriptional regulator
MASASAAKSSRTRQRVPASERRDALIDAAMHEFAATGYHGTPVDRIARSVGVAQPYVFSLFGSKRELFLAAVDRCFAHTIERMDEAAGSYPSDAPEDLPLEKWIGDTYVDMLTTDRDLLMLQLQAYAACDDPVIRERVRANFTRLARFARDMLGPDTAPEDVENFFRYGMLINVSAAMGVDHMAGGGWITATIAPDAMPGAADADADADGETDADGGTS